MDPRFPVDEDVLKQKNLFDSAPCYSERSPTPRSASQFSGGLVSLKNAKKSHDTATSGKIAFISSKKKSTSVRPNKNWQDLHKLMRLKQNLSMRPDQNWHR